MIIRIDSKAAEHIFIHTMRGFDRAFKGHPLPDAVVCDFPKTRHWCDRMVALCRDIEVIEPRGAEPDTILVIDDGTQPVNDRIATYELLGYEVIRGPMYDAPPNNDPLQ